MDTEWISFRIPSRECKNILPLQTHHTSVFFLELPLQLRQKNTVNTTIPFYYGMVVLLYADDTLLSDRQIRNRVTFYINRYTTEQTSWSLMHQNVNT